MLAAVAMKKELVWHIDRAVFDFDSEEALSDWARAGQRVLFEFEPAGADDRGKSLFLDPRVAAQAFELTQTNSTVRVRLEGQTAVVTAWVRFVVDLRDGIDGDAFDAWVRTMGGWSCATISLFDTEASLSRDDGSEFRF